MTLDRTSLPPRPRASEDMWLNAAHEVLCESGVEAVKVMPLAKRLGLTRTGFYWHFKDRDALLEAMITRWEDKNTGNLVARCEAYAETICEAMYNLFDCWMDTELFDSRLDLAVRNWARNTPALQARVDRADTQRLEAVTDLFRRFGFDEGQAATRARTVLYTQVGYISMRIEEGLDERFARACDYIEVFTGTRPAPADIERFRARHAG